MAFISIYCIVRNFHEFFAEKTFAGLLAGATLPNFAEKIFVKSHKTSKFAKVFSLESFPLYGMQMLRKRSMFLPNKCAYKWHCIVTL